MATTKPEQEENALDEARETPEQQAKEKQEGTEQHSEVPLTEEFQREVLALLKSATKEECSFIRNLCYEREEEIRKSEMKDDNVTTDDYDAVMEAD